MKDFSLFLRRWLPVGLWAGFMLYASTSVGSGDHTAHFFRPLLAWIWPDLRLASYPEINFFIRKTAHVIQFLLFTLLLWRALRLPPPLALRTRDVLACAFGTSAVLAILSEGIQLFSPMRTAQIKDVWLDLLGSVIGVGLVFGIQMLRTRLRRRPSKAL